MKRYIFSTALVAAALLQSCSEGVLSEQEKLNQRIAESKTLEVEYTVDGTKTTSLNYDNKPQSVDIMVAMNDSNLVWTLESNREWCKVVDGSHKGPGTISIEVQSNESFEDRSQATLTFVAGNFRGFKFTVDQRASVFLFSQPYFISSKSAGSYEMNISVPKAGGSVQEWTAASDSWLKLTKLSTTETDEYVTTKVRIDCAENTSASRYGAVTVKLDGKSDQDKIWFSQFGTEYKYDDDGNLFFGSAETASISFYAPVKTISSLVAPDYVKYEIENVDDEKVKVTVTADENFSDCAELRTTALKMVLANMSATELDIPAFSQDYVPAHGLLTAKGMFRFADAVNSGASTSDWEENGKIVLLQDIDMSSMAGWTGIGTESHPFKGTFEGNKHRIDGLKGSCGLFGVADGATIQNVSLGSACNIYSDAGYATDLSFGGIVSDARSTSVKYCSYAGDIEFAGMCSDSGSLYLGGVVGKADASSSITAAQLDGMLTCSSGDSEDVTAYIGGIAGCCEGKMESSECSGFIELSTAESKVYCGGVAAVCPASATMASNSFMGTIDVQGTMDESHVGGIYGEIRGTKAFDSATDQSIAMGVINVNKILESATTRLFIGGFAGTVGAGADASFTGYEVLTNFYLDNSTYELSSEYLCVGGLLAGSDPAEKASKITAKDITYSGSIYTKFASGTVSCKTLRGFYAGILAYADCDAYLKSCTNKGMIGVNNVGTTIKNSNSYTQVSAGILASAEQGSVQVADCVNLGNIYNSHYSNRPWDYLTADRYVCDAVSGIVGFFDAYSTSKGGKIEISGCSTSGGVFSYRGMAAGIIAFGRNATISKCKASGKMDGTVYSTLTTSTITNGRGYVASIGCVLDNSTVTGCTGTSNMYGGSPGSERYRGAGIAAILLDNVTISDCAYYGSVSRTATTTYRSEELISGIAAQTTSSCIIKDCKFGGTVDGTRISSNNVDSYVTADGNAKVSGISYWDGQ